MKLACLMYWQFAVAVLMLCCFAAGQPVAAFSLLVGGLLPPQLVFVALATRYMDRQARN